MLEKNQQTEEQTNRVTDEPNKWGWGAWIWLAFCLQNTSSVGHSSVHLFCSCFRRWGRMNGNSVPSPKLQKCNPEITYEDYFWTTCGFAVFRNQLKRKSEPEIHSFISVLINYRLTTPTLVVKAKFINIISHVDIPAVITVRIKMNANSRV